MEAEDKGQLMSMHLKLQRCPVKTMSEFTIFSNSNIYFNVLL